MNTQSTVRTTLALLILMAIAAIASGFVGFKVGSIALEGVAQPENNPSRKLSNGRQNSNNPELFQPISEKAILTQVYNRIQAQLKPTSPSPSPTVQESPANANPQTTSSPEPAVTPAKEEGQTASHIPPISDRTLNLSSQAQGVTLTVENVRQEEEIVVFKINLKNETAQPVKFSYRFLEIKDDQNRTLNGITEGLPDEIPAHSPPLVGEVKIPGDLVQDSQQLTLNLSNYPDQTLTLTVKNIPLVRAKPAKASPSPQVSPKD
jgi:hypothetical protein